MIGPMETVPEKFLVSIPVPYPFVWHGVEDLAIDLGVGPRSTVPQVLKDVDWDVTRNLYVFLS